MEEKPIVVCPHCKSSVIIEEINCKIFRHGIYKETGQQMDPHLPKNKCDEAVLNNWIYGCGKPFRVEMQNDVLVAIECDYI
jgi:hypothetical protein